MPFDNLYVRSNRVWTLHLIGLILFCGVGSKAFAADSPSVLDPGFEDALGFLVTKGVVRGLHTSTQPYARNELISRLRAAQPATDFDRALIRRLLDELGDDAVERLSKKAWTELRVRPDQDPRALPAMRAALRFDANDHLTLYQEFDIVPEVGRIQTARGGSTAQHRVRGWNPKDIFPQDGYAADFTRAFVTAEVAGIDIGVGRQFFDWDVGDSGGLILSDASPALDSVSLEGEFKSVRGTAVFAVLNRMWHDDGATRYLARRYFGAHRVHWKPSDRVELSVSETILYGGDVRPMEWYYLNPLLPFYASQFNASTESHPDFLDDNAMFGFDARWSPRWGWAIYGELVVDDYRYDPESNDPHALGWTVGLHRAGWLDRGEWRAEYTRVGRYTYTHLVQEQQYTHFGASLGDPAGNDSDALVVSAAWRMTPDSRLFARMEQRRKGESGVDDRFRGEDHTTFLKGVGETRRSIAFGGDALIGSGWFADGSVTLTRYRNRNHEYGRNDTTTEWRFARRFGN